MVIKTRYPFFLLFLNLDKRGPLPSEMSHESLVKFHSSKIETWKAWLITYKVVALVSLHTIPNKSLGTLDHFCSICLGNLSVHPPPPIQCCLLWWICHFLFLTLSGGRGFPIPVMSLLIVSKIACQRIFVLSCVPRTFVMHFGGYAIQTN